MKIEVEVKKNVAINNRPFPKLMKHNHSNLIVLFKNPTEGTVISRPHDLGYHSDIWMINNFTDFEGTITLSND